MVGYNSHIFGTFMGWGLGNFVHTTRPFFNKKLEWDIAVIYLKTFIWVRDWEILYVQQVLY